MTDDRIVDCTRHGHRECPHRRSSVVLWFLRHPIHSHCGCDACALLREQDDLDSDNDAGEGPREGSTR